MKNPTKFEILVSDGPLDSGHPYAALIGYRRDDGSVRVRVFRLVEGQESPRTNQLPDSSSKYGRDQLTLFRMSSTGGIEIENAAKDGAKLEVNEAKVVMNWLTEKRGYIFHKADELRIEPEPIEKPNGQRGNGRPPGERQNGNARVQRRMDHNNGLADDAKGHPESHPNRHARKTSRLGRNVRRSPESSTPPSHRR